jgi:hypothetical protein
MAARLNNRHQQMVKDKIQASQLINRLQNHANGEIEMSSTQVDAAKFLLNKVISNAPVEIDANIDGELAITTINRVIIDPAHDTDSTGV